MDAKEIYRDQEVTLSEDAHGLLALPFEMQLEIMRHLDDNALRALACVCNQLYDAVSEGHFHTLHATMGRLLRWQRGRLLTLRAAYQQYYQSLQVGVFNANRTSPLIRFSLYSVALLFSTVVVCVSYLVYIKFMSVNTSSLSKFLYSTKEFAPVAIIGAGIYLMGNDETKELLLQPIDDTAVAKLRGVIMSFKESFPNNSRLITTVNGGANLPTFQESLNLFRTDLRSFDAFLQELNQYRQEIRLSNRTQIVTTDLSPESRPLLSSVITFWNTQLKNERDIIELIDVNEHVP